MTEQIEYTKIYPTPYQPSLFPELDTGKFEQEVMGHIISGTFHEGNLLELDVSKTSPEGTYERVLHHDKNFEGHNPTGKCLISCRHLESWIDPNHFSWNSYEFDVPNNDRITVELSMVENCLFGVSVIETSDHGDRVSLGGFSIEKTFYDVLVEQPKTIN